MNKVILEQLIEELTKLKDSTEQELDDILPQYRKYCDIKRRYQLKMIDEEVVIESMKNVCAEIKEFIESLYSHTDTPKERTEIKRMLQYLYKKY